MRIYTLMTKPDTADNKGDGYDNCQTFSKLDLLNADQCGDTIDAVDFVTDAVRSFKRIYLFANDTVDGEYMEYKYSYDAGRNQPIWDDEGVHVTEWEDPQDGYDEITDQVLTGIRDTIQNFERECRTKNEEAVRKIMQ